MSEWIRVNDMLINLDNVIAFRWSTAWNSLVIETTNAVIQVKDTPASRAAFEHLSKAAMSFDFGNDEPEAEHNSPKFKESAYTERIQELSEQRRKLIAGIHNLLHLAEMHDIKLIVADEMQDILNLVESKE